jgi:hypothetical protein
MNLSLYPLSLSDATTSRQGTLSFIHILLKVRKVTRSNQDTHDTLASKGDKVHVQSRPSYMPHFDLDVSIKFELIHTTCVCGLNTQNSQQKVNSNRDSPHVSFRKFYRANRLDMGL